MSNIKKGLFIEGILAVGLAMLMYFIAKLSNSMYLLSYPFDLIGKGLRSLSLSSVYGNILACLIYVIISVIPVSLLLHRCINKHLKKADILLPILSIYLFYMLYEFINPGLMLKKMPEIIANEDGLPLVKMSFAMIFYSLCFIYVILCFAMNLSIPGATHKAGSFTSDKCNYFCLQLKRIFVILSTIYTFFLGYFTTFQMFSDYGKCLKQFNIGLNCTFVVISYLLNGLPILLSIFILLCGIKLLDAIASSHLQDEEIQAAAQLSRFSKNTVYITLISNLSLNILQFVFSKQLINTDYTLRISLIPLVIAFAAMILSGFFQETKKLHEDNEMII